MSAIDDAPSRWNTLANQLRSPLLFLLVFAAAVSVLTGAIGDGIVAATIFVASVTVGYRRERVAENAAAALRNRLALRARVLRDGVEVEVAGDAVADDDVLLLSAGTIIAADCIVLEANDCEVDESVLTGESQAVTKQPGDGAEDRSSRVFMGTNVLHGTARCRVTATGASTQVGRIGASLASRRPETAFAAGVRRFGYLLSGAMLVLVALVFTAHAEAGRPFAQTLLFSVALAVGLSPELLPAVLGFNLASGAARLAKAGVLVRHLEAIENLGSMDVLCTDKTGTLTVGVLEVEGSYDCSGRNDTSVLELAAANARLDRGLPGSLDDAIAHAARAAALPTKLGELPFDFQRKRASVVIADGPEARLITKGAFHAVVAVSRRLSDGTIIDDARRAALEERYVAWSRGGVRVLGVAYRTIARRPTYSRNDECDLTFAGFVTLADRPRSDVGETLDELQRLGVAIKIITGDSRFVAEHVANSVGLAPRGVLVGSELHGLADDELHARIEGIDIFAEVDPADKERIVCALKRSGHIVGFLGDGVNDAPAMHEADASLSVDTAVDVARQAADFVLLEKDFDVIRAGVAEGRRTFANTMKYILTTTSANLGNMLSMAAASLFLPFLPMLASQILLNNFISDIPAVGIATDNVDAEAVARPRRWDLAAIAKFMLCFGALSSLFDAITFYALLGPFAAADDTFRTAWFVESLLTELLVALVVRTQRPLFASRPGRILAFTTALLVPLTFAVPFLPRADVLGFVPLSTELCAAIALIALLYVVATELMKHWFYAATSGTRQSQLEARPAFRRGGDAHGAAVLDESRVHEW